VPRAGESGASDEIQRILKEVRTSSIKPWLKVKARELDHKPSGVYYELTKEGRKMASTIYKSMRS